MPQPWSAPNPNPAGYETVTMGTQCTTRTVTKTLQLSRGSVAAGTVPFLIDHEKDGKVIAESDDVVQYLNHEGSPSRDMRIEQTCESSFVFQSEEFVPRLTWAC